MALAIIVDDRTDVWEDNVKSQIVQARPFNHYPALAAQLVGACFLPKHILLSNLYEVGASNRHK